MHSCVNNQSPPDRSFWLRLMVIGLVISAILLGIGLRNVVAQSSPCIIAYSDGFENSAAWQTQTNGAYAIISDYQSHTGRQAAYLAGVNNAQDDIHATVNLPQALQLTMRFYWLVDTEENGTGYDALSVILANANGDPIQELANYSDINTADQWLQASVDLTPYAGQTVQLQFQARTDDTLETDFFVDDVEIQSCSVTLTPRLFLPVTEQ